MEVYLTPENTERLQKLAAHMGRDTAELVGEAVDGFLEQDSRFHSAVQKGFASLDRGQFVDEQEMEAKVERMLGS